MDTFYLKISFFSYLASLASAVGESGRAMKRGLTATPLVVAVVVVAAVVDCEMRRASSYVGGGVSVLGFPFPAASVVAEAAVAPVVVSALPTPSNKVASCKTMLEAVSRIWTSLTWLNLVMVILILVQ